MRTPYRTTALGSFSARPRADVRRYFASVTAPQCAGRLYSSHTCALAWSRRQRPSRLNHCVFGAPSKACTRYRMWH